MYLFAHPFFSSPAAPSPSLCPGALEDSHITPHAHDAQHSPECTHRHPPGFRFLTDRGHSMACHRVGFFGHCQFLD